MCRFLLDSFLVDYLSNHNNVSSRTYQRLILGIVTAAILQIIFSQWSVMNTLFATAPLNINQWLICLLPMLPMIPMAFLAHFIDPPSSSDQSSVISEVARSSC